MLNELRNRCNELMSVDVNKYTIIDNILKNDNCFFEMNVETIYSILNDLGYNREEVKKLYLELTNQDNFER